VLSHIVRWLDILSTHLDCTCHKEQSEGSCIYILVAVQGAIRGYVKYFLYFFIVAIDFLDYV
jgi:hypothetical protein